MALEEAAVPLLIILVDALDHFRFRDEQAEGS